MIETQTGRTSATRTVPFTIDVPQSVLDDLAERLARVRWPQVADPTDDSDGVSLDRARALVEYWRDHFDWRAAEARLNRLGQGITVVDGIAIHHVHERAVDPSGLPMLLLHGWPDSFVRYEAIVGELTAAGHDVVVPSLPGFGFSDALLGPTSVASVAAVLGGLMAALGYERYAVHGGDWGSLIAEQIAADEPNAVAALHLTDVPFTHMFEVDPDSLSDAERRFLQRHEQDAVGSAYQVVQSLQPTLLAFGLADSPVALATWMYDKFRRWSDREPDLDSVLTQVTLYWVTGTIHSSMRLYGEGIGGWEDIDHAGEQDWSGGSGNDGAWGDASGRSTPTAFAMFPADLNTPPREYAERFFHVQRYTLMPRGGHFAALEEPQLLAEDLVSFLHGRV